MWRLLVMCLSVVAAQNVTEVKENEVQTTTVAATTTTEQSQQAQQELQKELDYYSMPALSDLDDFDLCLRRPGAVYCIVDMELMEDDTPLYQYIKNYSTFSYKNYKHSKLHRGVCADQHCGLNLTHVNASEATATALRECFNSSIHQGYGLQVEKLSVRYCKTQNDWVPPDALDYVIGALILALLLVNLGCSAHYFLFPPEKGEGNKFMLAFCVQKNWKALKHGGSAEGGLFKCFQAMRFITMVMILGLHSMIFIGYGYTANPEFIEHVHIKILGALHFFDSGSYQTADDGDSVISLSQPSMSRAIEEVTSAIVELLASVYIRFPRTVEEKCRTMREFQEKNNMPNELGALDGTHIAIFKPDSNDPIAPGNLIYNRKEYYSINCL
ncbi:hypothetical protein O0L34_g18583 [Tuta absoluta]|nr:hypothetical protein O0L34_g18583 [Tuta absoluta]